MSPSDTDAPAPRAWFPGTGKQRLSALWLLVLGYLLLQCVFPFGPWYANDQYILGLQRSWAVASVTLWIGVLIAAVWAHTVRMRIAVLGASLLLSAGVRGVLDEDRRLSAALLRADHLVVHAFFIDERGGRTDRVLTVIDDPEAIRHMAETLRFDQDPPWRMVFYFTIDGDFTVDVVDDEGEVITSFIVINRGQAIRWRPAMVTDRHTPQRFQEALVDAVLQSIPGDGGISSPESDRRLQAFLLSWCRTPEAVRRMAAMIPNGDSHVRAAIASVLGMWEQPDEAVEPLLELARDPEAVVREAAIRSLSNHRDVAEVREFLMEHGVDAP
ncbi:HEAT repeat domain-containing protein [Candidatus Sumerlaeota bacterium]|nr:HEAT repeat domain-containing protein [Candidatus Sumerlaeota bacterium]